MKRLLALLLAVVMVCTLLPAAAFAADSDKLYIADTVDAESATEVEKSSDASGSGWSWSASNQVLTLNGFNGQSISADGNLSIVLKGSNTITLSKADKFGIKVGGKLTINKNSSDTGDKLTVTQSVAASSANLIQTGANDAAHAFVLNGGTVNLNSTAVSSGGAGVAYWAQVNNAACLNITAPYKGVGSVLETNTTGTVTVTTNGNNAFACAAYTLNAKGTGTVTLNATNPAVAVFNGITIASTAGKVVLNGFVKSASDPLSSFSVAYNKKIESSDSYYMGYYTTDANGNPGYYLCSSSGAPLASATFITDTDQPLTIMDSKILDLKNLVVGESYTSSVALISATRGGAGSYTYSVKSGSAIPAGLEIDAASGKITGKPTASGEAGSFVAVVTDKNGATSEVTINYSAIKASEGMLTLNAGSSSANSFSVNSDSSGTGWSYTAATKTLTLRSYSGGAIHCDSDLNIVLKGANTITVPGSSTEGINVAGKLTIDKTTNSVSDTLTVKQTTTTTSANLIVTGGEGAAKSCEINGGNVVVTCSSGSKESIGFVNWVYVNNDASLTVTAPYYGVKTKLITNTSGVVTVSSSGKTANSAAVGSLTAQGSGAVTLTASGSASTVYSKLAIADSASTVTLSGYTKVLKYPYNNFSIAANKSLTDNSDYIAGCKAAVDSVGSGYYLTDSEGTPLTTATFTTKSDQALTIMDSPKLDIPESTIGVKLSHDIYLINVTRGGAGNYTYTIKEGYALPAGLKLGEKTGAITGTPTEYTEAGSFVVVVTDADGATAEVTINYGRVNSTTPDAPVASASNDAATGKVKISWAAVPGAQKYKLYRATSKSGTYSCISTTASTSVINKNNSTIGKCYYYYVVAVGYSGELSAKSAIVYRTVDCARPVVTASSISSTGKIKLTWDAVDGAAKYEVYRSTTSTSGYTKLSTTTSTSLTNTSATAGVTYYYKVKAIASSTSSANSAYSVYISKACKCARPVVTASSISSTGKIKLTWDAVDGADKYYIYRSTDGKSFSYYGYSSKTAYTNSAAEPGKTYYYKVKAICTDNTDANSAYSTAVSCLCKLAAPEVTKSLSNGHPRLAWNTVEGADKYVVYRSTSKTGTYTKIYTTTGTSMTNSSAKAGTTYYYKVMAVYSSNSNANSSYSNIVYVKAQ